MTKHGEPQAFIDAAIAAETDECIIWPYVNNGVGYGMVWDSKQGAKQLAHRLVLERTVGPPSSEGMYARHMCHTPSCINPKHLAWGTPTENSADRHDNDTVNHGSRNGAAVLSDGDVLAIRADTRLQREIAAAYGVSQQQISRIKRGHNWFHLTQEENIDG